MVVLRHRNAVSFKYFVLIVLGHLQVLHNQPLSYPADLWALGCVIFQVHQEPSTSFVACNLFSSHLSLRLLGALAALRVPLTPVLPCAISSSSTLEQCSSTLLLLSPGYLFVYKFFWLFAGQLQ